MFTKLLNMPCGKHAGTQESCTLWHLLFEIWHDW